MFTGLSDSQLADYNRDGFVMCPNVIDVETLAELNVEIDRLREDAIKAREIGSLEGFFQAFEFENDDPDVLRRIMNPHRISEAFRKFIHHPSLVAALQSVLGPSVRLQNTKLNIKAPGVGALVDWHQDFAHYPHANRNVSALGFFLDDINEENAPLMVFPNSHSGDVLDHHDNGIFVGSIDLAKNKLDVADAAKLTGPAGSISLHHGHAVHGSEVNRSTKSRRMLFLECAAGDAWPLLPMSYKIDPKDIRSYAEECMLVGGLSYTPRMEATDIRLPLPLPPVEKTSLYEMQAHRTKSA
ncbi:MAG: phytanoyl-CoA dioxygenase family protein [Pseudomonadota bacterium]